MTNELRQNAAKRQSLQDRTDSRPFASQWLDSAYQETILYNAPWDKVKKMICDSLAQKIDKQRDEPERMQIIFQLVGPEFKKAYFPDLAYEPLLLLPPNLNNEQVAKLRGEAQSWLSNQAQKASKEVGCGRVLPGTTPAEDLSDQQLEFLQRTYEIFLKNLDRYMVQKEREESQRLHETELEKEKLVKEERERGLVLVQYRSPSTVSTVPSSAMSRKDTTLTQTIRKMVGPEPNYHCFQTETVSLSVKEILQRDPKRFADVAQRLHGRQIGSTLRTYCWLDVLFKADRDSLREGNVEKLVRSRFINHVRRGVIDLSVKQATHSPISGLIENAVVETYSKTLAMQPYNYDNHLKDAARALNVLYVYDRTYEPYLVHWIFPLQLAMREHAGSPEYPYELAMYLDLLNRSCFPRWPKIFAMADKSMLRLADLDPELYDHLKTICLEDIEIDPKEFMVYLIHEEREKAQELLNLPPQSSESFRMSKELLADALIFLRKWIGEGFVSVLDTPAVLFLWDQTFLQYWQGQSIENMCLTLLELLRYKFLEAKNYKEMKHVFLTEPGKLYTADIQRGWIHVERGGNPLEVQFFNRQRPVYRDRPATEDLQRTASTPLRFVDEGRLQVFGVKNFVVKLVIPSDVFFRQAWTAQFDPDNIKMMFVLYFSEHKIAHRLSTVTPTVNISSEGNFRILTLEYHGDVLIFDHEELVKKYHVLDTSVPFLGLRIDYLQISGKIIAPHPLAWTKVDSHIKKVETASPKGKYKNNEDDETDWLVNSRKVQLDLVYGLMPQCVLAVPPKRAKKIDNPALASGSQIQLTIFDPTSVDPASLSPVGSPETISQEAKSPSPEPEKLKTPLVDDQKHWVQHEPAVSSEDTQLNLDLTEAFDLYIDTLRFLPDNATIVKITGRFLKTGEVSNIPDIAAFPETESDPKNPVFNYRMVVNDSRHNLDPAALLIIRVYTVEKHTRDLVVIGSCLLDCVRDGDKINTGGYQLRLRNGMPDISQGMQNLTSTSLDSAPTVPSATVLVRILPHEPGYRVMPDYGSGYYDSTSCYPNQSEWTIFERFTEDTKLDKRWTEVIEKIKGQEDQSETKDLGVRPYMEERMDPKRYLPPQTPARNLNLKECIRYRIESGLSAKIQAFGLSDGLWCQCLVFVQRGPRAAARRRRKDDKYSDQEKKITSKLDYTSAQKAPKWTDHLSLHPYFDRDSFLVIELYGMKFQYKSKSEPKILGMSGQPLGEADLTNAWGVVPLFTNEALMTGDHLVPMYKGLPDEGVLQRLTAEGHLGSNLRKEQLEKYQSACFNVKLVDLHFIEEEFPIQPLPTYRKIIEAVGDSGYSRTSKDESGKVLSDLILRYLPAEQAKAGAFGANFEREKRIFDDAAHAAFVDMMKLKKRLN